MPMYEYACGACGQTFEELVSMTGANAVACPSCGSKRTEKLLSKFQRVRASGGGGEAPVAVGGGGGCCGGGCGCGR
jgi:putative FmdB family regulatory protein